MSHLTSQGTVIHKYDHIPIIQGPLTEFNKKRKRILAEVIKSSLHALEQTDLDQVLGEAAFQERHRLRKIRWGSANAVFNIQRHLRDFQLWKEVASGLRRSSTEVSRTELLKKVAWHYSEEIGGHFSESIYKLATQLTPWIFSWLLNAASVKRFLPWKMTENLRSRLVVEGEIEMLQSLSKKGTILLVPTHQSNMDSLLVGYVIYLMKLPPFAYGAGLNLFTNPVLSFFMNHLGAYTVDRQKNNRIYKNVLKSYSTHILKEGIHSVFYPGGGRSRSGAIESSLKLGLLGTGLQAQIERLQENHPHPSVFIVPMVTSYEYVLEASSLIEEYLSHLGQHRFLGADTEDTVKLIGMAKWAWKFFSGEGAITVRIGRALDVFGNLVDKEGRSIGPNGSTIEPRRWLMSKGEVCAVPQRDEQYIRELGRKIVDRYYHENVVLPAHAIAFAYFQTLQKKYPQMDLFELLRLSYAQRSLSELEMLTAAKDLETELRGKSLAGELHLHSSFGRVTTQEWIQTGVKSLGLLHDHEVIKWEDGIVTTEDMNLVYYYRNRLSGYGLSVLSERGRPKIERGGMDEKGILA